MDRNLGNLISGVDSSTNLNCCGLGCQEHIEIESWPDQSNQKYRCSEHADTRDDSDLCFDGPPKNEFPDATAYSYIIPEVPTMATRHNIGKVDYTLLPVEALKQESLVWMMGEKKYSRWNWKKLWGDKTIDVVMASAMRHSLAIMDGELVDPESGLPHAAHVRANMAMIIHYMKQEGMIK